MQKLKTGQSTKYKYLQILNCGCIIYINFPNMMEDWAERISASKQRVGELWNAGSGHNIAIAHIYTYL